MDHPYFLVASVVNDRHLYHWMSLTTATVTMWIPLRWRPCRSRLYYQWRYWNHPAGRSYFFDTGYCYYYCYCCCRRRRCYYCCRKDDYLSMNSCWSINQYTDVLIINYSVCTPEYMLNVNTVGFHGGWSCAIFKSYRSNV
jgi:hypothetical protein